MILANKNLSVPLAWCHKPEIKNKYGFTVAMCYANHKAVPINKWNHDPKITNKNGDTVAMLLAKNGILPP